MSSQLTLYRRPSTKHTMIVMYLGHSVKEYRESFLHQLNILQLLCPDCHLDSTLIMHGSYCRNLIWEEIKERIPIVRVLCGNCSKTHALLPDFIAPYRQYAMPVIEPIVIAVLAQGVAVEKADGFQDVSTTKRWSQRFRSCWDEICGALQSIAIRLTDNHLPFASEGQTACWQQLQGILDLLPTIQFTSRLGQANIFLTADQTQVWL